jgi:hypothetical protein
MNAIKSFCDWVGHKGLLHAMVCYSIMLTVYPIFSNPFRGAMWSFVAALLASVGKEVFDIFREDNLVQNAWHDLLCDAIGMAAAVLTWLLWWVCGL